MPGGQNAVNTPGDPQPSKIVRPCLTPREARVFLSPAAAARQHGAGHLHACSPASPRRADHLPDTPHSRPSSWPDEDTACKFLCPRPRKLSECTCAARRSFYQRPFLQWRTTLRCELLLLRRTRPCALRPIDSLHCMACADVDALTALRICTMLFPRTSLCRQHAMLRLGRVTQQQKIWR